MRHYNQDKKILTERKIWQGKAREKKRQRPSVPGNPETGHKMRKEHIYYTVNDIIHRILL